jgi:hypothetical protein
MATSKIKYLIEYQLQRNIDGNPISKEEWMKGMNTASDMIRYDSLFVSEHHPGIFLKAIWEGQIIRDVTADRWRSFGIKPPVKISRLGKDTIVNAYHSGEWFTYIHKPGTTNLIIADMQDFRI